MSQWFATTLLLPFVMSAAPDYTIECYTPQCGYQVPNSEQKDLTQWVHKIMSHYGAGDFQAAQRLVAQARLQHPNSKRLQHMANMVNYARTATEATQAASATTGKFTNHWSRAAKCKCDTSKREVTNSNARTTAKQNEPKHRWRFQVTVDFASTTPVQQSQAKQSNVGNVKNQRCVAGLLKRFETYYKKGQYLEAKVVAELAAELAPDHVAAQTALRIATIRYQKQQAAQLQDRPINRLICSKENEYECVLPSPDRATAKLIQKTYRVADLVIPVAGQLDGDRDTPRRSLEKELIKLIRQTIAPESWFDSGGSGTIQYFPLGRSLVIKQSRDIHEQVADLFDALRRLQDLEVAVETRLISVPQETLSWIQKELNPKGKDTKVKFDKDTVLTLNDQQVLELLKLAQGDRRANIMQVPRVTVFNGQSANIDAMTKHPYVYDIKKLRKKHGYDLVQQIRNYRTGISFQIQPVATADQRAVRLALHFKQIQQKSMALVPKTIRLQEKGDVPPANLVDQLSQVGFNQGYYHLEPISVSAAQQNGEREHVFQIMVPQPQLAHLEIKKTLTIPDGQTALIVVGETDEETRHESCSPLLSQLPYIGRAFRTVHYSREKRKLLLLVTPRLIRMEKENLIGTPTRRVKSNWVRKNDVGLFFDGVALHIGGATAEINLTPVAPKSSKPSKFRFPTKRTQVRFVKPSGMKVHWYTEAPDGTASYSKAPIEIPGRYNFRQAAVYRLKLTQIPGHPDVEIYPTLEVVPANPHTEAFLAHSAVPLSFSKKDFDQVVSGNHVVKVIYMPNPRFQDLAFTAPGVICSSQLEPGADPIREAQRRGSLLMVLRMGNDESETDVSREDTHSSGGRLFAPWELLCDSPTTVTGPATTDLFSFFIGFGH